MKRGGFQIKLLERFCGKCPKGWKTVRLGEMFSERCERREPDKNYPLYSFTIENGVTPKTERYERSFLVKEDGEDHFKSVYPGDFVLNPMNLRWGAIGQSKTQTPVTVSGYYDVLIPKFTQGGALLQNLLRSYPILSLYDIVATGSLLEKRRIHCSQFLDLQIYWPSDGELPRLSDILTTWDEALEKLDALIAAKERRKKALMQQLLFGGRTPKGIRAKWRRVRLGDAIEFMPRIKPKPPGKFLSAGIRSHGRGVFLKEDFVPEDIALDELFELKAGDLVVNITFAWEGAAAIVPPEADGALVSHRFPTFTFRKGVAAPSFFKHYILTHRFVFNCGLASPGGAGRNRVLSKSAFLNIELNLPAIEDQERIGNLLDTAAQEITVLRAQRAAIDQQKRGLMQRLLTGRIRV